MNSGLIQHSNILNTNFHHEFFGVFFEILFYCVALANLKQTMYARIAWTLKYKVAVWEERTSLQALQASFLHCQKQERL